MEKSNDLGDEYAHKLRLLVLWPLKVAGLCRFDVKGGRIVKLSASSFVFSMFALILTNYCSIHVLYVYGYREKYLILTEVMVAGMFAVFYSSVILSIAFTNRSGVSQFINTGIEVDNFLGVKETEFMRDVSEKTYIYLISFDGFAHLLLMCVMFFTYVVLLVELSVYIAGTLYGIVLFFIYYDLTFFVTLYTFLTLRVRYLNVTLMKKANISPELLPTQFPFNAIFWKKSFDDLIDFHMRSDPEKIIQAFRMLFSQLRCIEDSYSFTMLASLAYIIFGTLVIVQCFVVYAKSADIDVLRLSVLTGWNILSWFYQTGMIQTTDMLYRQIKQTNLICTYIQLTPTYPDEMYKLTKAVIRTLEVRDARISVYGMFYYDMGLMMGVWASLLVYITMELQLSFPVKVDYVSVDNITTFATF